MASFAIIILGSVVGVQHDEFNRTTKAFVSPGIMDGHLQFVKRAILSDACYHISIGDILLGSVACFDMYVGHQANA